MGEPIPGRAFDVAVKVRTLTLLARLTAEEIPINPAHNGAGQLTANGGLDPYERHLVEAASEFDWLLAEILLRLYNGETAGLSLVDFVAPGTVLALWYALPADKRRYLRAVFGTEAAADMDEAEASPDGRLAVLDRLVAGSAEEVPAAMSLLDIITTPSPVVEHAIQEMAAAGVPAAKLSAATAAVARDARDFAQRLLAGEDPDALVDEFCPTREVPNGERD